MAAPTADASPAWALGYDVPFLSSIASLFKADFSPFSFGAFGIPNERDVAAALQQDGVAWHRDKASGIITAAVMFRLIKAKCYRSDFAQRSIISEPGDLSIRSIAGNPDHLVLLLQKLLARAHGAPAWLEVHAEHPSHSSIPEALGFSYFATRVTASSEIKALWFRGRNLRDRCASALDPVDIPALLSLPISPPPALLAKALKQINDLQPSWAQHYSSYNKRKSWTAIALNGYLPSDPSFIIKPGEMSKAWKKAHPHLLDASCSPTSAGYKLDACMKLAALIPGTPERIRLMKLAAGHGELSRHADITDRDAGTADGFISRFHIPLQTAPDCLFSAWQLDGSRSSAHFPVGSVFYLDVRKPHAVINSASVERIHLVVDVASNQQTRSLLSNGSLVSA